MLLTSVIRFQLIEVCLEVLDVLVGQLLVELGREGNEALPVVLEEGPVELSVIPFHNINDYLVHQQLLLYV